MKGSYHSSMIKSPPSRFLINNLYHFNARTFLFFAMVMNEFHEFNKLCEIFYRLASVFTHAPISTFDMCLFTYTARFLGLWRRDHFYEKFRKDYNFSTKSYHSRCNKVYVNYNYNYHNYDSCTGVMLLNT